MILPYISLAVKRENLLTCDLAKDCLQIAFFDWEYAFAHQNAVLWSFGQAGQACYNHDTVNGSA